MPYMKRHCEGQDLLSGLDIKQDNLFFERTYWRSGIDYIAGVDEAGRGPLAGPVVAAAVILQKGIDLPGVVDSKLLSPAQRNELSVLIQEKAAAYAIGVVEAKQIDSINILSATKKAMCYALERLSTKPQIVLIDGNQYLPIMLPQKTLVAGDRRSLSISAASILAKVTRDAIMDQWHEKFPMYGFRQHKGYSTRDHLLALQMYGPCVCHRKSFKPVKELLDC